MRQVVCPLEVRLLPFGTRRTNSCMPAAELGQGLPSLKEAPTSLQEGHIVQRSLLRRRLFTDYTAVDEVKARTGVVSVRSTARLGLGPECLSDRVVGGLAGQRSVSRSQTTGVLRLVEDHTTILKWIVVDIPFARVRGVAAFGPCQIMKHRQRRETYPTLILWIVDCPLSDEDSSSSATSSKYPASLVTRSPGMTHR